MEMGIDGHADNAIYRRHAAFRPWPLIELRTSFEVGGGTRGLAVA
jgi:hypothetical protein